MTRLEKLRNDMTKQRQSIININFIARLRINSGLSLSPLSQEERDFLGRRKRKINSLRQKIRSEIRREK